jgi:hypothetical protein
MLVSTGCQTGQTRSIKPSGFLDDYSHMERGTGKQAQLVYITSTVDFAQYTKIMMEPVVAYEVKEGELTKLEPEALKALLDYMDAKFREELGKDYTFVSAPGADVMRLRLALTEADASRPVSDTLSSVIPIGIAVNALHRVAVGENFGTGSARAEMEILDSVSGEQLIAALDERGGKKYTGRLDKFSRWEDARDAIDYWAARARLRLTELRGGQDD